MQGGYKVVKIYLQCRVSQHTTRTFQYFTVYCNFFPDLTSFSPSTSSFFAAFSSRKASWNFELIIEPEIKIMFWGENAFGPESVWSWLTEFNLWCLVQVMLKFTRHKCFDGYICDNQLWIILRSWPMVVATDESIQVLLQNGRLPRALA